jgi:hypothetical protein
VYGYAAMTKKRLRQLASGVVAAVAIPFIVWSTWQIIRVVYGGAPPERMATAEEAACTAKLRTLQAALERASDRASREPDDAHAQAAFDAAVAPEWDEQAAAERTCDTTPRGRDAWAALLRLRRGLEGRSKKDARDIGPLRRDFETRLP